MTIHNMHTSIHGRALALSYDNVVVARNGYAAGAAGKQIFYPSPDRVAFFDDFDVIPETALLPEATAPTAATGNRWVSRVGSDGACVGFTYTTDPNGIVVGTIGNTTASYAVSGVQLTRATAPYKASSGDLYFETRLKMSRITNIGLYAGFTDLDGTTKDEMPINATAALLTLTTNTTDGCGFLFDTADTSTVDNWLLAGVANNTDSTVQATAIAPVADTYATFAIAIDTTGAATFFYNGTKVGQTMTGAVTASVALVPVIAAFNRTTTGAPTVTVDYIGVSQLRV